MRASRKSVRLQVHGYVRNLCPVSCGAEPSGHLAPSCPPFGETGCSRSSHAVARHGYAVAPAGQGIVGDSVAAEAKQGKPRTRALQSMQQFCETFQGASCARHVCAEHCFRLAVSVHAHLPGYSNAEASTPSTPQRAHCRGHLPTNWEFSVPRDECWSVELQKPDAPLGTALGSKPAP